MEMSNDSLFAMEPVKLAHGRADLRAILGDEVTAATGRMSVSGKFSRHYAPDHGDAYSIFSVRFTEHGSICPRCSSVPGVQPSQRSQWWAECDSTRRVVWLRVKEGSNVYIATDPRYN
jgi:hypothetical protein